MPLPEHRVLEHNRNPDDGAPSAGPIGVAPEPAIRADLLDPALWQDGLATYARATNLAVALADAAGRLIGSTINPRPTWGLLHAQTPPPSPPSEGAAGGVGCPFSLAPLPPCNCVAAALARGGLVVARDRTGLVHFAVPLMLGERPLGALVAGQVFDQYAEQLSLEQAARQVGLSPARVWQVARLEHPVKRATLEVYADLLATLGQTFLQTRDHTIREAERLAEMTRLRDGALAEMSARRQLEETLRERTTALEQADVHKNEFLAMLAHELRNPLAAISNAVVVSTRSGTAADIDWGRDVISRQVGHLSRLIDDLLDVSRITQQKVQLRKQFLDALPIVLQAVEAVRPFMEERRHTLTLAFTSTELRLHADPTRLEQVLVNLLTNAAKYTRSGGRIELTAGVEGADVVFRVRDNGVGIAPELLGRMFDLFAQGDRSLARSEGGLGIGLTLVRSLAELHGGSVTATSAGAGQGSEFVVRLPLVQETPAAAGAAGEQPERTRKGPARRILVVDDNQDNAEMMAVLLRLDGHEVRIASDGPAALDSARGHPPDVVLCDIGLPGMSGLEVARLLRQDPGLKDALLLALTGYGQDEDQLRSREAGFNAHLIKPVDLDALQALLNCSI